MSKLGEGLSVETQIVQRKENILKGDNMRITERPTLIRDQALERLRAAIVNGRYEPGARLIERELCELIGVSRTSVREALRQLQSERLVTVKPRLGPQVTSIGAKEAEDIYELRIVLEDAAVRLFIDRASDQQIELLKKLCSRFKTAATRSSMAKMIGVMAEFYDAILSGTGNSELREYGRQLQARVNFLRVTSMSQPGRVAQSVREIEKIVSAIAARDANSASDAATQHIRNASIFALQALSNGHRPIKSHQNSG